LSRREFPKSVRVAAFERACGRCECCTAHLVPGKYHYDHLQPDALAGEPTLKNCRVLCMSCHNVKTAREDTPRITKANRQRAGHIGAKTKKGRPMAGTKASGWKKKMSGEVVRR
jgi:5-methylcytosine-specific restriction endonuclease McrA